ncbi:SlyX family protein [Congregibacter variabilis]|uniref:SlyX family protein n=1 Tax=Congregibacter variabilis TaxID=3081200 RepID=A0ABZ0I785_9GAMM|nr:SlyX family protein [Congregibacter sp. IMCC43200]
MNDDRTSAEIATLQAEIAFQGDSVQRLNDALASQQQDILMLQRQVALLGEQLRALRENGSHRDGAAEVEKPPHY